ncbi:hypothetical protein GCM10023321_45410 [Pseudonocardia eucalypti]|uniref:Succinate dehydrogenase n=1 Tax=Pseudonocardia eucalypti TaxID=648755 RepID=A0ABP9QFY8_9PSEU|nr:hypothetical protein [Pseudonocardia eucalypti]
MPSTTRNPAGRARIGARTLRTDRWWLSPLLVACVLGVFIVYTTVRLFMRDLYWFPEGGYLTPLFSPCLSRSCLPGSAHFGTPLPALPLAIPLPMLVFPVIGGFRLTCYYYRKAGYRAFLRSPAACAVREPAARYRGESAFPLILQNSHRYFFYLASVLLLVNTYDAVLAYFPPSGGFRIGVGSLLLTAMVITLWLYSLSCHACRHLCGGRLKHFSRHPARYWLWTRLSALNARHMQFAWISLVLVMVADLYILSVSAGWIPDLAWRA